MASSRRSSPSSRSRRDVVVERSEKEDGGHTEIFMGIMVFMCIILIACIAIIIWYHVELHHKMNENDDLLHKMNDMKKGKAEEIPHTTQYQVQDYIAKNFTPSDNLRLRLVGMVYHYDLHMAVHLPGYEAAIDEEKKLTAEASVIVNFHALTKTNVIEFNAKHLKIKQVFIKRSTSSERLDFIINEKSEKVSVFFTEKEKFFYKGSTYMIRFDYDFKITTALEGLYQANYTTDAGETKTIATSQFEALYARMLAPMFDEPAYKIHHGEVFPVSFPYGRYRRLVIFIHTFDVDMQMTLTSLSDKGVYENDYANDLSTVPSVRKAHRKNFPMVYIGGPVPLTTVSNKARDRCKQIIQSTWAITVVHPKGTNAISNGRLLNNTEQNNFEQLRVPVAEDFAVSSFETTLRMSSYLLAVIVAPFTFEHKMTKKGVKVGISARPEAHHQIAYPLEAGCTILDKYTDMMDVAFPLPKLDMVAIPNFAAGAMENWGLVTYREVALLYSPDTGTHRERARALEVIAHELAHQWFGNLVTMKWWDDLWLNEGFATFIENFGVEAVEPGIERWNAFVAIQERAMESDSVGTASALKQVVDTLEKIDSRFDGIAYSKGASVINMIFHSIGARTFFLGVKEYLDKFALGNAVANDLWSHLSSSAIKRQRRENSSMNLVELATKYTEQAGYPYLRVKAEPSRDDPHKTVYQVTQKRYIVDGTPGSPENKKLQEGSRWDIPVFIRATAKAEEGFVIFPAEYTEDFKKIPVNTGGTIVSFSADKVSRPMLSITSELPPVLNVDSKGHYRVCYDSETLQEFVEMLKKDIDSLTVRSRERLYYDAFACAHIVQGTTYTDALSLFELLNLEKNHHAFGVLAGRPAALLKLFRREGIMRKLAIKYLQSVPFLENKANELESLIQFEGKDTYAESEMRLKMITVLCAAFEEECNQYFAKLFQSKVIEPCSDPKTPLSKCSQMNPLLREIGYCAAVKSDDKTIIDFLLQKYPTEIDSYEDRKMIKAISCTNDVELAQRLLERVHLDADNGIPTIRVQDAALVSYGIDGTGHGKINVDFFFNNFEKFTELFSRKNVADKMVDMLDDLSLNYDQEAISKFENEHKSYAEFESFKNVISKARARKEWLEAFGEEMKTIFNQKN